MRATLIVDRRRPARSKTRSATSSRALPQRSLRSLPHSSRLAGVLLVVGLAGLAACKKDGGNASCDAVGARFLAIAEADLARAENVPRDERDAVHGLVAPLRDAMVKACRQDGWSADARACYVAAPDEARFRACEAKLTGEQRALLEQSAAKGLQPRPSK